MPRDATRSGRDAGAGSPTAPALHGKRQWGQSRLQREDPPRSGNALEVVFAAVYQPVAGADAEVADGAADEHFIRPGERADPCADVHGEAADIVLGKQFAFARMQPRADLQAQLAHAVTDRGALLIARLGPSNVASAPSPRDFTKRPRCRSTSVADHVIVPFEQRPPGAVAHRRGALGRSDDVREQHGREDAVADRRWARAGEELLDLIDGPVHVAENDGAITGEFDEPCAR